MPRLFFHAVLLIPSILSGQSPADSGQQTIAVTLSQLDATKRIMVSGVSVQRTNGQFRLAGGRVTLFRDGFERTLAIQSIDSLWVRQGNWRLGAAVGGITGAALGVYVGAVAGGVEGGDFAGPSAGGALIGGLIGAAVGAGVGAVIGSTIPGWKRRYP